eukprot:g4855.t1
MTDWCRSGRGRADLLTAHHLDDQAETFLIRLQRGSGVDGLSAMAPVRVHHGVRILRPLLDVPRERLRTTLLKAGQSWVDDPSNEDERFLRVQVRNALPVLDSLGINRDRLVSTAKAMGRARAGLEFSTDVLERKAVRWQPFGYADVETACLADVPDEIALRLLARLIQRVGGSDYPPRLSSLETLLEAVRGEALGRGRTLGGVKFTSRLAHFRVLREAAAVGQGLDLVSGAPLVWDGRFDVRLTGRKASGTVRALGRVGLRQVKEEGLLLPTDVPKLALETLPALWRDDELLMQGGGGKAMGFGKSKAKLLTERHGRVTFDDVAGIDEAKDDLEEIVDFLRDPSKFQRLGGHIPKGVLLVGPPGTGKTLLARAIAGEANVPFFTISGSDFVEMFVGVGASRVRDMFEQAKKNSPCIIFIDEIDAVGRHRGAGLGGGNDEREQTLNQLLVEMDGFEPNESIILIAATNRPDVLDPALLRPGRFDRQVVVPNPDIIGREKILKVHMKKVPVGPNVEVKTLARGTPGFSGADLANLVNEAALLAARRGRRLVTMSEFEDAKDKVMMGAERRSMVQTEEERSLTAYHEGGHALVALHMPASDPIHKATIIPRGRALGMVMRLPEADQFSVTREKMYADLAVAMGGRVAEEIILGHDKVTSGASSDISQATKMAKAMVTQWGMSDKLGPLAYQDNEEEVFLGHSVARSQNMSQETQRMIDEEVRRIVDDGYKKANEVLTNNIDDLHKIAKGLLEFETLSGDEIKGLLVGETPHRESGEPPEPTVVPVLQGEGAIVSVDTFQTETQRWALSQNVAYLNDIQGFADESFYSELADASAKLIVMHSIQGRGPATRVAPPPGSMVDHVTRFFEDRFGALERAGVARDRLILDPGMGFFLGNQPEPSLEVIRGLGALKERFDVPLLLSVSRKSFLRKLAGTEIGGSAAATLAAELYAASAGADMIRTHEPRQLADSLSIWGHLGSPVGLLTP